MRKAIRFGGKAIRFGDSGQKWKKQAQAISSNCKGVYYYENSQESDFTNYKDNTGIVNTPAIITFNSEGGTVYELGFYDVQVQIK